MASIVLGTGPPESRRSTKTAGEPEGTRSMSRIGHSRANRSLNFESIESCPFHQRLRDYHQVRRPDRIGAGALHMGAPDHQGRPRCTTSAMKVSRPAGVVATTVTTGSSVMLSTISNATSEMDHMPGHCADSTVFSRAAVQGFQPGCP